MSELEPAVVLVGLDSITGLQSARILARRGIPVIAIAADTRHFASRTNAVRTVVKGPLSGAGLLSTLDDLEARLDRPATLLPCTDGSVVTISTHRAVLARGYRFVMPDHACLERLLDKARFAEHAIEHGLPIPRSIVLRATQDVERAADELTFPLVLKPAVKTAGWLRATTTKAFRLENVRDLRRTVDRFAPLHLPFVVQEWVPGGDDALRTVNAYFDRDGQPRVVVASRKVRQWPPVGGTGCLAIEDDDPEVIALAVRLFEDVGFRGLGYLEVKRDARTGRLVMIEANVGRPTGRAAMAEAAGEELLLTVHRDAHDRPLPASRRMNGARPVKWIYWRHDLQASGRLMVRGELGPAAWWRSMSGPKVEAVFDRRDPIPFFVDVGTTSARAVGRLFARIAPWRRRPRGEGAAGKPVATTEGGRFPATLAFPLVALAARAPAAGAVVDILERLDPPRSGVLPVLMYHRVAPRDDAGPLEPTLVSASPEDFAAQMEALRERHDPIAIDELLAVRRGRGRLPRRAVLVTFDDAYADFAEHAWPVLRAFDLPAVLFVPTAYPGDPRRHFWWDRLHRAFAGAPDGTCLELAGRQWPMATAEERRGSLRSLRSLVKAVPHDEAMQLVEQAVSVLGEPATVSNGVLDWDRLRALAADGLALAPHTRTHAMLDRLPTPRAEEEIAGGLADLAAEIGSVAPVIAYPSGQVDRVTLRAAAAAGIEIGFTTRRGPNDLARADWLRLRRINVGGRSTTAVVRAQLLPTVGRVAAR